MRNFTATWQSYDMAANTKNVETIHVFANNNQFKECNLFVKTSFNIEISLHFWSKNSSAPEQYKRAKTGIQHFTLYKCFQKWWIKTLSFSNSIIRLIKFMQIAKRWLRELKRKFCFNFLSSF